MKDTKYKGLLKKACEDSHLAFARTFFKEVQNQNFIIQLHHTIMAQTLDRVFTGEINRLVINVPPGYTKTEMAVIMFVARGLAINPRAKFIQTSYSKDLVYKNSTSVRDVINTSIFQELWPMEMRRDMKGKKEWYNTQGGGLFSAPLAGGITGYRAGTLDEGDHFKGALIIDDPVKPIDAFSKLKISKINDILPNTLKSRLADSETPVILIMQRLSEDDTTDFVLNGGVGDKWHHLLLPAEIGPQYIYPKNKYSHAIPIEYDLPEGALWPIKATVEQLAEMREANPYVTAAQYDQNPTPLGGGIYKDHMWNYYNIDLPPAFEYRFITADTAQKTKEINDYSVFICFGVSDKKLYVLDIVRGKWESPELKKTAVDFWNKHSFETTTSGKLRKMYIEDKASGTDLIQNIRRKNGIPVEAVQRNVDKVTRCMDNVEYVASGYVFIPYEATWLSDFKHEMRSFTPLFTHKHDDQVDAFNDGVEKGLGVSKKRVGTFAKRRIK